MDNDEKRARKRKYTRIDVGVPVNYSFSSTDEQWQTEEEYEGITKDISGGGFLLKGPLPHKKWIPELLLHRVNLSVTLHLPDENEEIETLTNVVRMDTVDEKALLFRFGLEFLDLSGANHKRLLNLVLKRQSTG